MVSKPTTAHTLSLPVVAPDASASAALRLMRKHGRSGVLSFETRWRLYEAAQVVIALTSDPDAPLSAVKAVVLDMDVTRRGALAELPVRTPALARLKRLRRGDKGGGLARPGLARAHVRMLQAGPSDCYCRVDLKPVARGVNGGDCPNGHRRSVRCL